MELELFGSGLGLAVATIRPELAPGVCGAYNGLD